MLRNGGHAQSARGNRTALADFRCGCAFSVYHGERRAYAHPAAFVVLGGGFGIAFAVIVKYHNKALDVRRRHIERVGDILISFGTLGQLQFLVTATFIGVAA